MQRQLGIDRKAGARHKRLPVQSNRLLCEILEETMNRVSATGIDCKVRVCLFSSYQK